MSLHFPAHYCPVPSPDLVSRMVILYLTHKAIIQPFYLGSPTCASSPFHTSHSSLHLWTSHSFLVKHSLDFAHVISSICFFISLIFTHFPGLHSDAVVSRKPCLPTPCYANYLPLPYLSKVFLHLCRLWLLGWVLSHQPLCKHGVCLLN